MNKTYFMTEMIRSCMDHGIGFPNDARIKGFSDAYERNQHLFLETEIENQSSNQSVALEFDRSKEWHLKVNLKIESLERRIEELQTDRLFSAAMEKEKFEKERLSYQHHTSILSDKMIALEKEIKQLKRELNPTGMNPPGED